jgi:hypothetical protein
MHYGNLSHQQATKRPKRMRKYQEDAQISGAPKTVHALFYGKFTGTQTAKANPANHRNSADPFNESL